jgi:hypothetical protein
MQNAVKRAYRLADGAPIEVREVGGERQLVFTGQPFDPMATVVALELDTDIVRK